MNNISKDLTKIPFNTSNFDDSSIQFITQVFQNGHTSGDGEFTKRCHKYLKDKTKTKAALLTHSCTAALEMSALLLNANIGDEVIMPSFTFVSTANAFVLRGIKPVFVDIREDNCNLDETLIENAITSKTRAIVPVHYAGVACEMDKINQIASANNLLVIEDAAQDYNSYYKGKHLGSIGQLGTFSFHETKNLISGEGGALLINDEELIERSHIIREKGTNRTQFFRGESDKYTWVDIGSSYLPSDLLAAYLYSNLQNEQSIQAIRLQTWNRYYSAFKEFQDKGVLKLPVINDFATNNAHMFYIRFRTFDDQTNYIQHMKKSNIITPFHYVPLHSSPAGQKYTRFVGNMTNTNIIAQTLVRLPIFYDLSNEAIDNIIDKTVIFLKTL